PEGILENNIFIIESKGTIQIEIVPLMNPRIKWTWNDYHKVLRQVRFRKVYHTKENFIIAIK
ncbi:hypothetical protein DRN93_05465, partial [archaeon]